MRHLNSFKSVAVGSALLLAALLQPGCNNHGRTDDSFLPPVDTWDCNRPVTKLLTGDAPGIPVAETGIIDNDTAWCDLWDRIYANASPPPSCDKTLVDFSSEVVLFAALGMRLSSGFTVEIACVHEDEGDPQLRVQVLAATPGPHCAVLAVLTYPISVVKVARPVQDAVFETTVSVQDCL